MILTTRENLTIRQIPILTKPNPNPALIWKPARRRTGHGAERWIRPRRRTCHESPDQLGACRGGLVGDGTWRRFACGHSREYGLLALAREGLIHIWQDLERI